MKGILTFVFLLINAVIAEAVQEHTGPEGLVVHELAHIFLTISALVLSFAIIKTRPPRGTPLRNLAMTGIFMAIWSITTFTTHLLRPKKITDFLVVNSPNNLLWYLGATVEHLFLFAALVFFLKTALSVKRFTLKGNGHAHASYKDN